MFFCVYDIISCMVTWMTKGRANKLAYCRRRRNLRSRWQTAETDLPADVTTLVCLGSNSHLSNIRLSFGHRFVRETSQISRLRENYARVRRLTDVL